MTYVIGLGSNLGDRLGYLRRAAARIQGLGRVISGSSVYETEPLGPPQGRYLNAALALACREPPLALLGALLEVERALGRERRERWGPRTIDLDLLWSDGPAVEAPGLTLPHACLVERSFALGPLLEVCPDARDPRTGARYDAILAALAPAPMSQVACPADWLASPDFRGRNSHHAPR